MIPSFSVFHGRMREADGLTRIKGLSTRCQSMDAKRWNLDAVMSIGAKGSAE
jgi:hypothetical protein